MNETQRRELTVSSDLINDRLRLDNAQIIGARYDAFKDSVVFVIEHPSFDLVHIPEAASPPPVTLWVRENTEGQLESYYEDQA